MFRKIIAPLLALLCFLLVVTSLYLGRSSLTWPSYNPVSIGHNEAQASISPTSLETKAKTTSIEVYVPSAISSVAPSPTVPSSPTISNGTILLADRISPYISAILNPTATVLPRLKCPVLNTQRYRPLQQRDENQEQIDYFFAVNLRNCKDILPRLLGSVVEVAQYLGVSRCALSIVEGNSADGTADVLSALDPFLKELGLVYFLRQNTKIDPSKNARIKKLAQLRNLALEPLVKNQVSASDTTTLVFLNDVAACPEDILELALQRKSLSADMTCAMDWVYLGPHPTFYDVWVARTTKGDSFFEVGEDGNWNSAWNLFWNDPITRRRFDENKPFQVFACWNGATAIGAGPILHGLRFRESNSTECFQGEPTLFCKDLWHKGFRKIAVIPSVNLEYSDKRGADIKELKGYVSNIVEHQMEEDNAIDWVFSPPEQVRCMPTWETQGWRPWNETL
ncbi:hypothetical protein FVEN_g11368 [Fusarium venenatum]|uniref:cryptococcal mannosyltransferase 1-domain-containing protein n=1 Tax=Fusarium venenatum TaxID=56646 RepID=UPI001E0EAF97|nr:hypothetical protein FVEN_g11368 [Fusarium venenatum]KAH6992597.1 cryptococcal mannosyltransferase 1-domain-containing protein [Fusarium venenatum]